MPACTEKSHERRDGPRDHRRRAHHPARSDPAIDADDLARFEALYEQYHGYVFRTAYALTGDRGLAEEILQDTFVRAYRHRANLWVGRSPLPWLNRVALNLCYTRLGRRRLPTRVMDEVVSDTLRDQALGPDEWAEQQELCADRPHRDRGPPTEASQRRGPLLPRRAVAAGDGRRARACGSERSSRGSTTRSTRCGASSSRSTQPADEAALPATMATRPVGRRPR